MPIRIRRNANGGGSLVTASFGGAGGIGRGINEAGTSQSTAYLLGADLKASLLEGIFDVEDKRELQATYRDIYYHDAICGSAVDLQATLPWSDFTLTGADDKELDIFKKTLEKLNVKTAHELMSKDRLVSGAFVASLVFDTNADGSKGFSDMIPFNYADCTVLPVPMISKDPALRLEISEELKFFAEAEELEPLRTNFPKLMLERFKKDKEVLLDPLSTVYLPRSSLSSVYSGVSYYRRVVPCYLLERVIYRGTITEATKRQRSLTHITVGDTEDWTPTEEDMNFVVSLFQVAETDPNSHIVATRGNVQVSDVMPHGDIWSWNDVSDQIREIKMHALGISDSFLSPDGSFDTAQTALSVFIESMRSFREHLTQKFYYEKLFPLIAKVNGLAARKEEAAPRSRLQKLSDITDQLNDTEMLLIPEIQWHKQLRPSGDQDYMDRLNTLQEKGLPIPLSVWAAAAGVNLTQLMGEMKDDKSIREKLEQYKPPKQEGEGEGDEFASVREFQSAAAGNGRSLASNVLKREYSEEDMEIPSYGKTGKRKWNPDQNGARRKINEKVARGLEALADPNEYHKALKRQPAIDRRNTR